MLRNFPPWTYRVWLFELAEQLPHTTHLDGLDVSEQQFPPKAWLPANVAFRNWDFITEVPPDLIASYGVVHIRLIAVTIRYNDQTVVVKNLAKHQVCSVKVKPASVASYSVNL